MTKTFVYRLKHKETGKYLNSIQVPNTATSWTSPHITLSDNTNTIFSTPELVAKIYARVDVARLYYENRNILEDLYNDNTSDCVEHSYGAMSLLKKVLDIFDQLELEVSELAIPEDKQIKKQKKVANKVIKDIRCKQSLAATIDSITETHIKNEYIVDGFQTWERSRTNDVDYIIKLQKNRTGVALPVLTFLEELGIKFVNLDSEKPNVIKGQLIGVSNQDFHLIKIARHEIIENSVAIKDVLQLQEELAKKFDAEL